MEKVRVEFNFRKRLRGEYCILLGFTLDYGNYPRYRDLLVDFLGLTFRFPLKPKLCPLTAEISFPWRYQLKWFVLGLFGKSPPKIMGRGVYSGRGTQLEHYEEASPFSNETFDSLLIPMRGPLELKKENEEKK